MSNFVQKTWETGETISAGKLNRMEEGISEALKEAGEKVAGSGWSSGKYLGTDENGNVVPKDIIPAGSVEIDATLNKSGAAADAAAVGQKFAALEQGVTDCQCVKDGNTITLTFTLDSGNTVTDVITLDDDGYPVTIVSNGLEVSVSWTGFDA